MTNVPEKGTSDGFAKKETTRCFCTCQVQMAGMQSLGAGEFGEPEGEACNDMRNWQELLQLDSESSAADAGEISDCW